MAIGHITPAEWTTSVNNLTGRTIKQLTSAAANSYPLYYFIPTITSDNRYLIFHSERSGWVQLYRLDLASGEIGQLTDGRTRDAGWAIWCEPRLRGIYNHLSSLNVVRREVYYFQDEEIWSTQVDNFENRLVAAIPGRVSIGQTGFSPDGKLFAFIHADKELFERAIADRESTHNMGQPFSHEDWRNDVPCTIGLIDTETGEYRDVIQLDYHVHHVFFLDDERLIVNHVRNHNGMWSVKIDGSDARELSGDPEHGNICHQIATERGILYESNVWDEGKRVVYFGRYDLDSDSFEDVLIPGVGYVHTGNDPAGKFLFVENQETGDPNGKHEILSIHHPHDPDRFEMRVLRSLQPIVRGQRYHAHPLLGPDRRWLYFTEVVDGFSQIKALDVADLADLGEYWR